MNKLHKNEYPSKNPGYLMMKKNNPLPRPIDEDLDSKYPPPKWDW
jgi:hypothetical protein